MDLGPLKEILVELTATNKQILAELQAMNKSLKSISRDVDGLPKSMKNIEKKLK